MTKAGMKFEMAKVTNKDGSPAIGKVRFVNRFGCAMFQITQDGKSFFSSDNVAFHLTAANEKVVVKAWL